MESTSVVGDVVDVRISFGTPVDVSALAGRRHPSRLISSATTRGLASTLRAGRSADADVDIPGPVRGPSVPKVCSPSRRHDPPGHSARELHRRGCGARSAMAPSVRSPEDEVLRSVARRLQLSCARRIFGPPGAARANGTFRLNALEKRGERAGFKPSESRANLSRRAGPGASTSISDVDEDGFTVAEGDL
jgi:hypothetical protein